MMSRQLGMAILWLLGTSVALAQVRMPARETAFAPEPITLREGQSIVNAAWERERQTAKKPDCSHLVHEVYTLAGYPYPYADSFDLYVGTKGFVREAKPQPGDLVVWRGHVGIVVDPTEHSFYSSVNSGLRTEVYDSPDWRARGSARFYRYLARNRRNLTPANRRFPPIAKQPVEVSAEAEDSRGNSSAAPESIRTTAASTPSLTAELESPTSPTLEIPSSILVAASRERPTSAEIAEAVSELNNATGNILREEDLSRLSRKVTVYESLRIAHIEFKGNRGSAEARIQSRLALPGESIERRPEYQKFRWELLRVNGGWEVLAPKDRVYLPPDVAVRALAARLASLAQDSGASDSGSSLSEQAQIVRALGALFRQRP
jgi:NlpC/P60 family protein